MRSSKMAVRASLTSSSDLRENDFLSVNLFSIRRSVADPSGPGHDVPAALVRIGAALLLLLGALLDVSHGNLRLTVFRFSNLRSFLPGGRPLSGGLLTNWVVLPMLRGPLGALTATPPSGTSHDRDGAA